MGGTKSQLPSLQMEKVLRRTQMNGAATAVAIRTGRVSCGLVHLCCLRAPRDLKLGPLWEAVAETGFQFKRSYLALL